MSKPDRSPDNQKAASVEKDRQPLLERLSRLEAENTDLQRSVESLHRLAEQYEILLNASQDGFLRTDDRGKLLQVNDAYCRMIGRTREELLHLHLSDLEAEETAAAVLQHISKIRQAGFDRFESRHRRKDGSLIDMEVSATWFKEDGQLMTFFRDIGDRKQAEADQAANQARLEEASESLSATLEEVETTEEELRTSGEQLQQQNDELMAMQDELNESRRHYEDLFQFTPYGYLITDPDGVVRETNRTGLALLGLDEDALLGKSLILRVAGKDREQFRSRLEKARAGGSDGSQEWEVLLQRGSRETVFPAAVMVAPIQEEDGSLSGLRWVLRDITERMQLEQAITESEEIYRNIVRLAPAAIYELDFTSHRVLSVNDTACQWSGYSRDELLAMDLLTLTDDVGRSILQHRLERRQAGKAIEPTPEINIYTKDGRQLVWALNAGAFAYKDDQPVSMLVVAHDITSRKRMEEEVRQTAEELRSANDELMRFNRAMVGRELRMIELKREINALCKLAGQPPRYPVESDKSKR